MSKIEADNLKWGEGEKEWEKKKRGGNSIKIEERSADKGDQRGGRRERIWEERWN